MDGNGEARKKAGSVELGLLFHIGVVSLQILVVEVRLWHCALHHPILSTLRILAIRTIDLHLDILNRRRRGFSTRATKRPAAQTREAPAEFV